MNHYGIYCNDNSFLWGGGGGRGGGGEEDGLLRSKIAAWADKEASSSRATWISLSSVEGSCTNRAAVVCLRIVAVREK